MNKYIYLICFFSFTLFVNAQEKTMEISLEDAINFALQNSYNSAVANNDILSAEKTKWETTTMGLPQINAKVDYQNFLKQQVTLADFDGDGVNEEFLFGTKQNVNATITLTQLLFDGSYLVGLESAKTYLKISEQAKEKTALTTRETVINTYGNVLVTEKSLEILLNNKKSHY